MLPTKRAKVILSREQQNINIVSLPQENIESIFLSLFCDEDDAASMGPRRAMITALVSAWRLSATCTRLRGIFTNIVHRMCSAKCTDPEITFLRKWIIRGGSSDMIQREIFLRANPPLRWDRLPPVHTFIADALTGYAPLTIELDSVDLTALGRVIVLGGGQQRIGFTRCKFAHTDITIVSSGATYTLYKDFMEPDDMEEHFNSVRFTFHHARKIIDNRKETPSMTVFPHKRGTWVERRSRALGIHESVYIPGHQQPTVFGAMVDGRPYQTSAPDTCIDVFYPGNFHVNGPTQINIAHEDTEISACDYHTMWNSGEPLLAADQLVPPSEVPAWAETRVVENTNGSVRKVRAFVFRCGTRTYESVVLPLRGHFTDSASLHLTVMSLPPAPIPLVAGIKVHIQNKCAFDDHYTGPVISEEAARLEYQGLVDFSQLMQPVPGSSVRFIGLCPSTDIVRALMQSCGEENVKFVFAGTKYDNVTPEFLANILRTFRITID
jgi:hypothetical protein